MSMHPNIFLMDDLKRSKVLVSTHFCVFMPIVYINKAIQPFNSVFLQVHVTWSFSISMRGLVVNWIWVHSPAQHFSLPVHHRENGHLKLPGLPVFSLFMLSILLMAYFFKFSFFSPPSILHLLPSEPVLVALLFLFSLIFLFSSPSSLFYLFEISFESFIWWTKRGI